MKNAKVLKAIGLIFATLLVLFVFVLTPLANPLWKLIANWAVEPLSIAHISGDIRQGMRFKNISWMTKTEQVNIEEVAFKLNWKCIFDSRVCVEFLHIANSKLILTPAETQKGETTSRPSSISLPMAIDVRDITIENTQLALNDLNVELARFHTQFTAFEQVEVSTLELVNLAISRLPKRNAPLPHTSTKSKEGELNAGKTNGSHSTEEKQGVYLSYTPPSLPDVVIPIPVMVNNVSIAPISYSDGTSTRSIDSLTIDKVSAEQSKVSLDFLNLVHSSGKAQLDANAELKGAYPLSAELKVNAHATDLTRDYLAQTQNLSLNINGTMDALNVAISADGQYSLDGQLHTNILTSLLPLDFKLSWRDMSIPSVEHFSVYPGSLTVLGEMGNYTVSLDASAELPKVGKTKALLNAKIDREQANLHALNAQLLEGNIALSGKAFFANDISWQGHLALEDLNMKTFSEYAPDNVSGSMQTLVTLSPSGPDISVSDMAMTASQQDIPFTLNGSAVYSSSSDILVNTLAIKQQNNVIDIVSQVFNKRYVNTQISIDLPKLNTLYPQVNGKITGTASAHGEWQNPTFNIALSLASVTVEESLNEFVANSQGVFGQLAFEGNIASHKIQIDSTIDNYGLGLALSGGLDNNNWAGHVSSGHVVVAEEDWALSEPFDIKLNIDDKLYTTAQHCWQSSVQGSICLGEVLYNNQDIQWSLNAKDLPTGYWAKTAAQDLVQTQEGANLALTSEGQINLEVGESSANFQMAFSPSTWQLGPEGEVDIAINTLAAAGRLTNDRIEAEFILESPQLGEMHLDGSASNITESPQLGANLNIDGIDLSPLAALSQQLETLTGIINGSLTISGNAVNPNINGTLSIDDGAIQSPSLPTQITHWSQVFTFGGRHLDIDGNFLLGEGKGSLSGNINWEDKPKALINLQGEEFAARQKDVSIKVSPNLTATIQPGLVKVTGDIDVPWARIEVEALPESAVSPSNDVHLRGEPPSEDPLDIIDASVNVYIDRDKRGEVRLDAFGLTANLNGGLKVETLPALTAYGDLQIAGGRYEAYGQNLIIRTGEIQFNGPVGQPVMLIEAIRDPEYTEDDVIAGVRIDGPATKPNVSLFSQPPMDQGLNLAYLLNGSAGGGDNEMDENTYAGILLGFGLSNTESLTGKVGQALGIDDFSLSTSGQGSNTKLEVSGRIAKDLTIRYGVGVFSSSDTNAPEVALRYQLTDNLYVEAIQGLYQALDVYYQFYLGKSEQATSTAQQKSNSN